jgi:hypothetical protein
MNGDNMNNIRPADEPGVKRENKKIRELYREIN